MPAYDMAGAGGRLVDAAAQWRSRLAAVSAALLLFEALSGLAVYLLPFGAVPQFALLLHVLVGVAMLPPVAWFVWRHWRVRRRGVLSHFQLLGYLSLAVLAVCLISGLILTWQGLAGPAIGRLSDPLHLIAGLTGSLLLAAHLGVVIAAKARGGAELRTARRRFYRRAAAGALALAGVWFGWAAAHSPPALEAAFVPDYNWRFGDDRPFAPSLARLDDSTWLPELRQAVAELLPTAQRPAFLALAERRVHSIGPLEQVRRALAGVALEPAQRARVEALLAQAQARVQTAGAVPARLLAGSAGCGAAGCHEQIYREWLPSAHRYAALDPLFQRVQAIMVEETAPEYTRYCAGCHDPISLFGGAKTPANLTLSADGAREGASCVVCHSIVQTDIQGNADYTLRPPTPYVYEWAEGGAARLARDFLIRTYPWQHLRDYDRPLLRRAEFCGACHKQYVDTELNGDIGKVQGQNQYDSWKSSRWYHEGDPRRTVSCRECHMPLTESRDPSSGDHRDYNRSDDDGRHRGHRMPGANQYVPVEQGLEGGEEHARLVERWLRGEVPIPEIADKWTTGPAVRLALRLPPYAVPGETLSLQVVLTNNKTGHDFPTGPLDMIESWLELRVRDGDGRLVYHVGALDARDRVEAAPVVFKADAFDRERRPIDRHNLWDLVGVSYKRALYPGMTDTVSVALHCPALEDDRRTGAGPRANDAHVAIPEGVAGRLEIEAILWYRKANPDFLDRIFGPDPRLRAPITEVARATASLEVMPHGD